MQKFTREKIETNTEKDIAISCIVSTDYLEQVIPILTNLQLISEPNIRRIITWCFDFYKQHKEAPGKLIHDIFTSNQKTMQDQAIESVGSVLENLNQTYLDNPDTYSTSYYVSKTHNFIEEQALLRLSEELKGFVSQGKIEEAKRLLTNFNKIDKVLDTGIDVLHDDSFIDSIFAEMKTGVIQFPYDALTQLFGDIYRGDVVAIAGGAKTGKSFLLNQMGQYALHSGLNTAVFSFEMDGAVMGMRFFQNVMGQTRKATDRPILMPYFDDHNNIHYKEIMKSGLELIETKKFRKAYSRFGRVGHLKFFDHHRCGRRVSDICDALDRIEKYDGIKIDVVIIDYDSLLENEAFFNGSSYEGINKIWKDVKAKIAQDRDTVVFFGSQYNKEGAGGKEASPVEAAGSSRKFDYVSHWCSLVSSEEEKAANLTKLYVVGRHDEFLQSNKVVCTQALGLARPILDCRWEADIPNYEEVVSSHKPKKEKKVTEKKEDTEKKPEKDWMLG